MELIATLKNGKKINCDVTFNKNGAAQTQYPIEYKTEVKNWCLRLTAEQVKELIGATVKHDENFIKLDKQYAYNELDKMMNDLKGIKEPTLEDMLKENTNLKLWWATNSDGDTIIDLPDELKKYEKRLVKLIDWKSVDGRDLAEIKARDLKKMIDEIDKKEKEIEAVIEASDKERISKLQKLAISTGKPQELSKYPVECDGSVDSCDIDTIVVLINPDGSQTKTRHHCY